MNILLVITGDTGLQYHRQISPHIVTDRVTGGNLINVSATNDFNNYPDESLKTIHIVYFLRTISLSGTSKEVIERCHKFGCKVIFDIDDYWQLPHDHGMSNYVKSINLKQNTEEAIKYADVVFTTTDVFAQKIKLINPNVFIFPNCIDKLQDQWKTTDIPTYGKVRFGWIGGVWHRQDLNLLGDSLMKLYSDKSCSDAMIILGGYDNNDEYNNYMKILSGYKKINPQFDIIGKEDYNNYGRIYDHIDVALVPLREEMFSRYKSPLKLVEAGAKGKAVIASEVLPYSVFPKNTFYPIKQTDNKKGWYKAIKYLLNNPELRDELASNLSEYCDKEFNAETHGYRRYETYKYIINK